MVKNKYKNNSSKPLRFQGIIKKLGQLRCYCQNFSRIFSRDSKEIKKWATPSPGKTKNFPKIFLDRPQQMIKNFPKILFTELSPTICVKTTGAVGAVT